MSERELVETIKQGNVEAFHQLYEQEARLIYRYILVRIGNPQDAEDLTSEVFIKAWQALPSFQWNGTPLRAWLLRISHNLVIDRYRKKKDLFDWLPWRVGYRERKFVQLDHQDEIQRALTSLSYEQQVILHLHFFEGYNLKEVAELLGKSPNAVRVAQYRALKRLREVLQYARSRSEESPAIRQEANSALIK